MAGYCPDCGAPREEGAAFCTQCGHAVAGAQATKTSQRGREAWRAKMAGWRPGLKLPPRGPALAAAAVVGAVVMVGGGVALWQFDLLPFGGSKAAPEQQLDLNLLPVRYGDKCGFVDRDGRPAINPQFDQAGFFDARSGLAPVALGDKWGLIDRRGQYVANPQFGGLRPIRGLPNHFAADIGNRVGIVDRTGAIVVNPQFEGIASFMDREGRIAARSGGKIGLISRDGTFLIPPQFDQFDASGEDQLFSKGLMAAAVNDRWGHIDSTGSWKINPQFSSASSFDEATGLALIQIEKTETVVDQAALSAWQAEVASARAQRQSQIESWGYSYIQVPDNQPDFSTTTTSRVSGFVNTQGQIVIAPEYKAATDFSKVGLAAVMVGDKWGYIDATGALKIAPQFDSAGRFQKVGNQALAIVGVSTFSNDHQYWRYGIIDATGKYMLQPQYDFIDSFSDRGLAVAQMAGKAGVVDAAGKFVINPTYDRLSLLPDKSGYLFSRTGAVGAEVGLLGPDGKPRISVRGELCE